MSRHLARSIRKAKARKLRQSLDRTYRRQAATVVATPVSAGLAMVRGSLMPAVDMPAAGSAVSVTNIGRAAAAKYAPDRGSATAVFVAGSGGAGGGGGQTYSAGDGLQLNADVFSVKLRTSSGLVVDGDGLGVQRDGSLQVVNDQLSVKAGAGLGVDGTGVKVNVGDGLEVVSDTTQVKLAATNPRLSFASGGLRVDSSLAGLGLIFDGNRQMTFNLDEPSGLNLSVDGLRVKVDDNTLALGASGLRVNRDHAFVWNAKHIWGSDALVVDPTQRNVWLNAGQPDGSATLKLMAASPSDHTFVTRQLAGQVQRMWRVEDSNGNELIVLTNTGALQSGQPGFVSGLTGWQITPTGDVEFNNGWFRGELHASVFVLDEIHVSGGTLLIATGARLLHDAPIGQGETDALQARSESGSFTGDLLNIRSTSAGFDGDTLQLRYVVDYLDIEDPPSGHFPLFQVGETLRCKFWQDGVYDLWFTVLLVDDQDDFFRYYVKKRSGTDTIIPAGVAISSYGFEGDGRVLLTSDLNYAPYIDVFSIGPQPWTGAAGAIIPHVRLGRLDGVGLPGVGGVKQYGMVASTDLSNANSPYLIASNLGLRLYKVDYIANNGAGDTVLIDADGVVKFGTDINLAATTGFHFDAATGDLLIGQAGGDYLKWEQSAGVLSINGVLTIGGSNLASESYADSVAASEAAAAESAAKTAAQGYANTAEANAIASAQNYTDGETAPIWNEINVGIPQDIGESYAQATAYANRRRAVGMSGTIGTTSTSVSWTNVVIRLADGTNMTITPNGSFSLGSGSGRWYMYFNVAFGSEATMNVTANQSIMSVNSVLIAVLTKRSGQPPQIVSAIGTTIIDGDNILTGTVTANQINAVSVRSAILVSDVIISDHIAAGQVTAAKIGTIANGEILVGSLGRIRSGKTGYGAGTGWWLGNLGGSDYGFDIGDSNRHLRYRSSTGTLSLRASSITAYTSAGTGTTFDVLTVEQFGRTMRLQAIADGWRVTGGNLEGNAHSHGLLNWNLVNGNTFQGNVASFNQINIPETGTPYIVLNNLGLQISRNITMGVGYKLQTHEIELFTPGNISGAASGYYVLDKLNSWSDSQMPLAYYWVGEYVTVQGGMVKSGNINGACGRLPVGKRPPYTMFFPCRFASDAGGGAQPQLVQVGSDGFITLLASPTTSGGNFQFQFSFQATQ